MTNKEAKNSFNRGQKQRRKGNYLAAITAYTKSIELEPNNAKYYYNRAIAYEELGELDQSLRDLNQTLAIQPSYVPAYHQRGKLYEMQQQWNKAVADYNQVVKLQPNYMLVYIDRALLYERDWQWHKALADYNQLIEHSPNDEINYFYRSQCYAKQGKYEQALDDNRKIQPLSPYYHPMYDKTREYHAKLVKPQDFQPIKIQKLELNRLQTLPALTMEFGGLNVFWGKSCTGKTTLLTLLYAITSTDPKQNLQQYFLISEIEQAHIQANLQSYNREWQWQNITDKAHKGIFFFDPVFLPPTELLSLYSEVIENWQQYPRFYSTTCQKLIYSPYDQAAFKQQESLLECFTQYYCGGQTIKRNPNLESYDAFIYQLASGETIPFDQGDPGVKKVQQLRLLLENHIINRDSVLLIDEIEADIDPALQQQFVQILAALAAKGVQIFIASQSEFVLKELAIASKQQQQSAFCFSLTKRGCVRNNLDEGVPDNEILTESLR